MNLKAYLKEKKKVVEGALERYAPRSEGPASEVILAMNYSLFAGGKRLRPILCLAGAAAVGGDELQVLPTACAIEMIHTYSLIHDDLPVMDNDDLRRGKPTSHKVFGEAVALLAGDGLLTEAFTLMARTDIPGGPDPHKILRGIALIGKAAGCEGMVGGQVVDIQFEGKAVEPSEVEFLHTRKTGALITASVAAGALLGGGKEVEVEALTAYGEAVGLAFQIADDILDIEGDSKKMGKSLGGDVRKKKTTYPSVLGMEESRRIQATLLERALFALRAFDERADPLRSLAQYIVDRKQ